MSVSTPIAIDFLVVGAQKAGTTSVHDWLAAHPAIALPVHKETRFFADPDRFAKGAGWYREQFPKAIEGKAVGEVDPEYLYRPQAAANIGATSDAHRFIVLLRHPLKRALSQYLMSRRRGYETHDFREALTLEGSRLHDDPDGFAADHLGYTARSRYAEQVKRFREQFPQAEFLFMRSDELGEAGYRRICAFIGVEPAPETVDFAARSNTASEARSAFLRDAIHAPGGKSPLRRAIVRMFPRSLKRSVFLALEKLNQSPLEDDPEAIMATAPRAVLDAMRDDLKGLEEITGLDLADWREDLARRMAE
ncbi:MAG: sulfotransferase [Erythrobacter sp.]|uniref:sulfotransferase family protein n=1 Tax=Erythrobacter sp. TaxID=1042 RepID=UPI0032EE35BD